LKIIVCITGSSGAVYAKAFLEKCTAHKFLIVSKWGKVLLKEELGISENALLPFVKNSFPDDDLTAPTSSGSNKFDACVILPCSASTVGKIASGIGDTLITRTAQVALKQRYRLVLCIRETPLSTITLEQCAKLSHDGAVIMPISPAMYLKPGSLNDLVNDFTDKLLGVLGIGEPAGWRSGELE
jgi:4-hydroxy-3-polyprenylbenzoate decarboxylase